MSEAGAQTLDGIDLLRPLPAAERAMLARQCSWRRFGPHEQIIDREEPEQDVYFVVSGSVRVVNYSLQGREISFDDIEAGRFFGELAAIDGKPRSASVVALHPTLVAALSAAQFQTLICGDPRLSLSMMMHLAKIVRRGTDRIMDLSTIGANNRVHAEILRLAKQAIQRGSTRTATISPIPVHGDIAGRVSTTRETVARVFSDLARAGIVVRRPNHLWISSMDRLEAMVEDVRGE